MATGATRPDDLASRLADDLDTAFVDLVLTRQDRLWAGVRRLVPDRGRAEDVVQETFARAHRALADWPAERVAVLKVDGWLWTIALNEVRNGARRASRRPKEVAADGEAVAVSREPTPEDAAMATAERARLDAALAPLPAAQREAVVLRHVVGLGITEIARVTDRPVGTVKSDLHRGLGGLRRSLGDPEADDPTDSPERARTRR